MLDNELLKQVILKANLASEKELEKIDEEAVQRGLPLSDALIEKGQVAPNVLFEAVAAHFGVPFIDLKKRVIRKDILEIVPEPIVQVHSVVAFDRTERELKIAMLDPQDLEIIEFLKKKTNLEPIVHITTPEGLKDAIKQYHKGIRARFADIEEGRVEEQKTLKKLAQDLPVVRIVDTILEYAIFEKASDIHIEPTEKEVIVRYRIDGILRTVMTLPKNVQAGVVARVKILSNLKLDEHRLPQDGRFKISTDEYRIAFRVSIFPVYDGEKTVLRLLNESAQILSLEQLGLLETQRDEIKSAIKKPHGIVLVTGPTGSGKTTTLYTLINMLNKPGVNISTVEDPIEYRMPGVNQSQVNPRIGFTFDHGLRSMLRQDPNIIMVGEIRDRETAQIAAQAAMTGHLVLSSLHTNDAAGALPRLVEMGVPSFLVASTANVIVAQRLVRKICTSCITSFNLTKHTIDELAKEVNLEAIVEGLESGGAIESKKTPLTDLLFYRGKGCKACNHEGYRGRIGTYEVLMVTKEIADVILKGGSTEQVHEAGVAQGMITLVQDGFILAKNGITTIEEVLRVSKE